MASIRKRTWKSGDEVKTAWVADYSDQSGKRHLKTFERKKDADAFLVAARGEVQRGTHTADSGSITVAGDEITHMSASKLTAWRARHVGFIFQMYNLIPVLTAFQNVELPLLLTSLSKAERRKHVETALGIVGLSERMNHYPRQLSGGQEQRVAIARAIVADPTFLLCDEPTGDLDRKSADEIMDLIHRLVKEFSKTVLMVTHDPIVAKRADLTLHLEKGVLVEAGDSLEIPAGGAA